MVFYHTFVPLLYRTLISDEVELMNTNEYLNGDKDTDG